MMNLEFYKYQGTGNDFIIFDLSNQIIPSSILQGDQDTIKYLCSLKFGIGADGVILAKPTEDENDIEMRIFNSDGSIAEMCGNGVRCLVKFLYSKQGGNSKLKYRISTLAGDIKALVNQDETITIDMGKPVFEPLFIPTYLTLNDKGIASGKICLDNSILDIYSVGMGNPHLVTFMDSIEDLPLDKRGPILGNDRNFPKKTNVHFVEKIDNRHIKVKVWERGAGATLACGTGACACLAVNCKLGFTGKNIDVELPGGTLNVNWPSLTDNIYMKGPAEKVYSGSINV